MKILVSACLLGCKCRYDGKTKNENELYKFVDKHYIIPFCPEQAGGMTTPRTPCEIANGKVLNSNGHDFTGYFINGANETLNICNIFNIEYAILKSKSPSCGFGLIYDGTFSGKLINGNGFTADLLNKNGIKIYNENNCTELLCK